MSYAKKAVKGIAVVFIINIIAAFVGYLIRIVLARNLTVAEYGLFFAVFTLINFLAMFSNLGTGQALVKYIPEFLVKKKPDKIKSSIVIAVGIQLVIITFFAVVLFAFSGFLAHKYFKTPLAVPVLLLFILIMFFAYFRTLLRNVYQAFQRMTAFVVIYFAENFLILIFLLSFFFIKKNIFAAVYSHIIAYALILIIFTLFLFKIFNFFEHKIAVKKPLVKKLLKFGIPVMFSSIGGIIILYTDTLILTYFRSLEEVGIYNVVVPTVMMLIFFAKSVMSVIFPMTSELWARNKRKFLEKGLILLEKYSFIIILPVSLVVLVFSGTILSLMFGAEYSLGATTMQVLIVGIIFLTIFAINSSIFWAIGKPAIATKILLQGALINFVLNLFFIPWIGMLGAAITSLITYFYVFIMSVVRLRKFIKVRIPWKNWLKTFISGIIMIIAMFLLKELIIANAYVEAVIIAGIGGLVYAALILLMKVIDVAEIKNIIKIWK